VLKTPVVIEVYSNSPPLINTSKYGALIYASSNRIVIVSLQYGSSSHFLLIILLTLFNRL